MSEKYSLGKREKERERESKDKIRVSRLSDRGKNTKIRSLKTVFSIVHLNFQPTFKHKIILKKREKGRNKNLAKTKMRKRRRK